MLIKKSLPKCLIGFILFLMIGLPLIVLVFYGGYITGGEFSISKKQLTGQILERYYLAYSL
ncbi:Uncharacterised protein [Yersinia enterocolitica]|nr:Uncharacterised protein [Yersinia enterocolitica]